MEWHCARCHPAGGQVGVRGALRLRLPRVEVHERGGEVYQCVVAIRVVACGAPLRLHHDLSHCREHRQCRWRVRPLLVDRK